MASTNFCEIAARYLDILETDGLQAAAEMASESNWAATYYEGDDENYEPEYCPINDCVSFIAQRLEAMYQEQYCARNDEWEADEDTYDEPVPCIATALGAHPWKWLAHYKVQRAFQLSSRYALRTRKFSRWELTDINGDRVGVYTEYPLTIAEASRELSEFYSVSRIQGLA